MNDKILEISYYYYLYFFHIGNVVSYNVRTSFKILVGIWLLSMVVLIFAYSGVLTSLLSVPKLEPTVNTLEDLVKGGQLRITIEKNVHMSREFLVNYQDFRIKK